MAIAPAPELDPSAAPEAAAPAEDTGYTIEIKVSGDGSITVSSESANEEAGEESAEGGEAAEAPEGTPVKSIKEALTLVLDIYRNDGQASQGASADDQMNEGFGTPNQGEE